MVCGDGMCNIVIVTSTRGGQVDKTILLADNIRVGARLVGIVILFIICIPVF